MKYILKKEYPGSPKLGNTIDNLENDWIENYPEFWELVVEKDYEILELSLQRSIKHQIVSALENSEDYTISLLSCNGNKIHSVKRLFDGEIFTIGDIVKCEDCKGKITSLEIYDNDIYLNGIDNKMPFGYTLCNTLDCFEIPQKVKQPLFTTEDGVDIFEGDEFIVVNIFTFNKHRTGKYLETNHMYKYFSTKEKAEEYILLNKPCLSYGDVQEYLKVKDCNKVLDLAQSKIQQSV